MEPPSIIMTIIISTITITITRFLNQPVCFAPGTFVAMITTTAIIVGVVTIIVISIAIICFFFYDYSEQEAALYPHLIRDSRQ